MPGVPREVIEHKLMVRPDAKPVKQKLQRFAPDRKQAIREELDKLLKAGFIREVLYLEWLTNLVMVRKANGKWRMCVDFTDLNKACPKDHFPLPRIDQLVDSTAGCELLSFLDAYSGYYQISMAKEDEEKTTFITPFGVFCYVKMPFGLITAGNTFQRTVQGALSDQLGNNVEAYIDNIVVKTKTSDSLIDDLRETFDNLQRYRLMLNPEKCTFGVPSGKLLGFLVSGRGIEANPEKIKAIENMKSPTRLKEVQKLIGCMAALSSTVIVVEREKVQRPVYYISEAMLPTELRHQSKRVHKYSDEDQEEQRYDDVNLLEEHRERVAVRAASYQQALRCYHKKRIRACTLSIGDYVLRRVQSQAGRNKLSPKWEGPYTITQVLRPGAFKIADGNGRELANSWNIDQLRKFYV
uniref:Retrotransposon protein, putative, unclassified n=1 Tax=Oryza sativa subsp. japonica TaxID=39947 RepID=Q10L95_ORYSJ|nr:retrotransposon protein, putative, unclassified [Oryza sativa Japonica Group]